MSFHTKQNGFTLVELMIVVIIIGILASVAYPAYVENLRATKRSEAQADLMQLASLFEKRFTENNSYLIPNGATDPVSSAVCGTAGGCVATFPTSITNTYYNYQFLAGTPPTATGYDLSAIPQNDQANDKCGTLGLDETGVKVSAITNCWKQ